MAQRVHKLPVWICNIVLAVLAALSIACYFMGPFWQININCELTAENIQEMTSGQELPVTGDELKEIIGEDGVKISLPLVVPTTMLVNSFGSDAAQLIVEMVDSSIGKITAQLLPAFEKILTNAVPVIGKKIIREAITSSLDAALESMGSDKTAAELEQQLGDVGITDDYIAEQLGTLTETLTSDDATVDSVTESVMNVIDDVQGKLESSVDPELKDAAQNLLDDKENLETQIRDVLTKMANEDGKLDTEAFINGVLGDLLNQNGNNNDQANANVGLITFAANDDISTGGGSSAEPTDLSTMIADILREQLPADTANMISLICKIACGVMFFSMAMWLFVLVKIIVKFLARSNNPTVKLKSVIWLGWLPFLILVAIPSLAMMLLPKFIDMSSLPAGISISFFSMGIIAAVCAAVALGVSFWYMHVRKKIRRAGAELGKR